MEKDKLWARFKELHRELMHKKQRENIVNLNKILRIPLEEELVDHTDHTLVKTIWIPICIRSNIYDQNVLFRTTIPSTLLEATHLS